MSLEGDDPFFDVLAKRRANEASVAAGGKLPKLEQMTKPRRVAHSLDTDSAQKELSAEAQTPEGEPAETPDTTTEENAEWV